MDSFLGGKNEVFNPLPLCILGLMIMFYFYWVDRNKKVINMISIATRAAFLVIGIGIVLKILSTKVHIMIFFSYAFYIFLIAVIAQICTAMLYSLIKAPAVDEGTIARAKAVMNSLMFLFIYSLYSTVKLINYSRD